MAWLDSDVSQRVDQGVFNYKYQYAIVDDNFIARFPLSNAVLVAPGIAAGDEVVRRIRQNVIDYAWPGLTEAYSIAKLTTLRLDKTYKNPTAKWNGAGGYDVTATRIYVDPAGWSNWLKAEDAEEAWV